MRQNLRRRVKMAPTSTGSSAAPEVCREGRPGAFLSGSGGSEPREEPSAAVSASGLPSRTKNRARGRAVSLPGRTPGTSTLWYLRSGRSGQHQRFAILFCSMPFASFANLNFCSMDIVKSLSPLSSAVNKSQRHRKVPENFFRGKSGIKPGAAG